MFVIQQKQTNNNMRSDLFWIKRYVTQGVLQLFKNCLIFFLKKEPILRTQV